MIASGEWINRQKHLKTKESKRGPLLKLIYQGNLAPKNPEKKTKAKSPDQEREERGGEELDGANDPTQSNEPPHDTPLRLTTLGHYLARDGVKNVHISNGLHGYLFHVFNYQRLKPTRKRYATRRLQAMGLPVLSCCPSCFRSPTQHTPPLPNAQGNA